MKQPRKVGRPGREPRPGERVPLGLRVTPDLKRRLDGAAMRSGRSQSQEAEFRLASSFDREDLLREVLSLRFGDEVASWLLTLGLAAEGVGGHCFRMKHTRDAETWAADGFAVKQALEAMRHVVDAIPVPEENREAPDYRGPAAAAGWSEEKRQREIARDLELPRKVAAELIEKRRKS